MSTSASCSPATIYFFNSSVGVVKSFSWLLGNGTTSKFTDASAIYVSPGIYVVKLTVIDDRGNVDTITKQVEIYANPKA